MSTISLPRARRRRRKPFGPREKWALTWVCTGVFCVVYNFVHVTSDIASGGVDVWTGVAVCLIVYWVRRGIPIGWRVIRAWLDSGDDA